MSDIKLLVEQSTGKISFNYEETKAFLSEKMSEYDGALFSDDSIKYAKAEVAFLRKLKDQMDSERKRVKAAWMAPYEDFKAKVDELMLLVDKPINAINDQVKDYEKRKKEEKKALCRKIYGEEIGDVSEFLTFDRIFNDKWLNVSTSEKAIRDEIRLTAETIAVQLSTIKAMVSDSVDGAVRIFKDTLDFTKAMAYISNYEAQKKAIMERESARKQEEEQRRIERERERIRMEERERIRKEEELTQAARQEAVKELKEVSQEVKETSAILPNSKTVLYAITATEAEFAEVEMTMTSLGICFERKC